MNDLLKKLDEPTRRDLMASTARACLGVGIVPLAGGSVFGAPASVGGKGSAKNVIYLYMGGGMTHLDTFDLKPGADTQGPTTAIKTKAPGIRVASQLSKLAGHMDKVAVINSMTTTQGAHEQGNYLMHTSYTPRGTIRHPGMGAWLLKLSGKKNPILPGNVLIGGGGRQATSGFMESRFAPLPIGNPAGGLPNSKSPISDKEFQERLTLANEYDKPFRRKYQQKQVRAYTDLYADAIKLMKSTDLEVFDIRKEPQSVQEEYGNNGFGQGCLLARRLIEQDVRFVEVNFGGWDTHTGNFDAMNNKLPTLDMALSALLNDLERKGLLRTTLVVLTTEFGRSPRINANVGRDHHPRVFSAAMAGGGIQGGQVYGKSDAKGIGVESNGVKPADFNATIAYALGLPLDKTVYSPSRRPFTVANKGKPVSALF